MLSKLLFASLFVPEVRLKESNSKRKELFVEECTDVFNYQMIFYQKFQNFFAQMRLAEENSLALWKNVATTFWQL